MSVHKAIRQKTQQENTRMNGINCMETLRSNLRRNYFSFVCYFMFSYLDKKYQQKTTQNEILEDIY